MKILIALVLLVVGLVPGIAALLLRPELAAAYPEFVWGTCIALVVIPQMLHWRSAGQSQKLSQLEIDLEKAQEDAAKSKGQLSERTESLATLKKELSKLEESEKSQRQRLETARRDLANQTTILKQMDDVCRKSVELLEKVGQAQTSSNKSIEKQAIQTGESLMAQVDDLLANYQQNRLGLESFLGNLTLNFEGIRGQAEELGDLCTRFEELRVNHKEDGYANALEAIAANLGLSQETDKTEESYSHRLQVLSLNLKNRDASQRLLVSNLERQGTEVVLRTEAALRTLRSRLEEIASFHQAHLVLADQVGALRSALGQQNGQLLKLCKEQTTLSSQPLRELADQVNALASQLSTGIKGA